MPNTSSTDEHYTDTIWLVVGLPDKGAPRLIAAKVTEWDANDSVWSHHFTLGYRIVAIPFEIPLGVIVGNALEAMGDET